MNPLIHESANLPRWLAAPTRRAVVRRRREHPSESGPALHSFRNEGGAIPPPLQNPCLGTSPSFRPAFQGFSRVFKGFQELIFNPPSAPKKSGSTQVTMPGTSLRSPIHQSKNPKIQLFSGLSPKRRPLSRHIWCRACFALASLSPSPKRIKNEIFFLLSPLRQGLSRC
jgi:hypothetical protein